MQTVFNRLPLEFPQNLQPCPACRCLDGQACTDYPSPRPRWQELKIQTCMHCGFGHVPSVPFSLDDYYATSYGEAHGRSAYPAPETLYAGFGASEERYALRARRQAEILREFSASEGRMLDVGAGIGGLLHCADAAQKFAIEGDQVSLPYLDHVGAERLGFDALAAQRFDTITTSHFAEHLLVPGLEWFLAAVAHSLDEGGWFFIEVPEWGHVHHRKVPARGGHHPHTLFFSESSLLYFLERAGFVPVHCSNLGRVFPVDESGTVNLRKTANKASPATNLVVLARRGANLPALVQPRSSPPQELDRPPQGQATNGSRAPTSHIRRRLRKLARNPIKFFADSPYVRRFLD